MHDDISGHLCGNPFNDAWSVSFTNTNSISGETGTAALSGPASGIQLQGRTILRLIFPPGSLSDVKVTRFWVNAQQEATVPLAEDKSCEDPASGR